MKRYFVHVTSAESTGIPPVDSINDAFESQDPLTVAGVHEGVAVEFSLDITRLTKSRENGRLVLSFSGVTKPQATPFIANHKEANEGQENITLSIDSE